MLGGGSAVVAVGCHPLLHFNAAHARWEVLPAPFVNPANDDNDFIYKAAVSAIAADGRGGFWLAAKRDSRADCSDRRIFDSGCPPATWFYHYTDRVPRPVFADVPQP